MTVDERASRVRLLLLDVDGVMTDGTVLIGAGGAEHVAFHIRDGAALVWAQRAGLLVGLLSGRRSAAAAERAAQLRLPIVLLGVERKLEAYETLLGERGLSDEEVAFMGDDLLDLPVLARAGLSAAPADAAGEVRAAAHWTATRPGGHGAVRELVELVLRAQGTWGPLVARIFGGTLR